MYPDKTLLGQGKCGPVYRATHPQSGQTVLLKILPPDGAAAAPLDESLVTQLAPQWMQIRGFNIAQLLGVESTEEGLALVSEYVAAPTVSNHPHKGKVPAAEALDIANQLLNALLAGEKVRQIHGDVKPSNVLIGTQEDGRPHVRLADWGINQTRAVHPMETYLFTAPERLDGSAPTLRADLFSVGHVLFFLLTGMALVKGRTPQEISNAWKVAAPDQLKKLRKDLPPKFVKFLLTLLELKPDKRPLNPSAAMKMLAELNPPALPQPAAPARGGSTQPMRSGSSTGPVRPAGSTRPMVPGRPVSGVPVQAPMQPPTQISSPGIARPPATVEEDVVPIVAMRPPPEIAAQLHLPVHQAPIPLQPAPIPLQPAPLPVLIAPGSHTQPFVTGIQEAIPVGAYTQPMQGRPTMVTTARGGAGAGGGQQRRPMPPPPPTSPLIPILTILVILSMIGTGVYFWINRAKYFKSGSSKDNVPVNSTTELMDKIKNSGTK